MATKYRFVGLAGIKVGLSSITTLDVIMPGTATTVQNIVPGTARVLVPEPEEQVLEVEDSVEPDVIVIDEAVKTVEFATQDMGMANFLLGFGGALSGTNVWKAPTTAATVRERSMVLITKPYDGYYYEIHIPKVSLKAGKDLALQNKQAAAGRINFRGTIMQGYTPTGVKVTPYKIVRKSS